MILLVLACSSPEPVQPEPVAAPPAQVEPKLETVYVHASVLKLRAESSESSRVLGRLDINTPLEKLGTQASWTQVRVNNGVEGWVVDQYLGRSR